MCIFAYWKCNDMTGEYIHKTLIIHSHNDIRKGWDCSLLFCNIPQHRIATSGGEITLCLVKS